VRWLSDIGALNDRAYASVLVRHYSEKGYGAARIKDEFFKRGVPRELWEEALSELPEMEDSIDVFILRKLRGEAPDEAELRRVSAALARRGFSWEEIRAALERFRMERNS
jgi:regulatory protein